MKSRCHRTESNVSGWQLIRKVRTMKASVAPATELPTLQLLIDG